ncbi:unnamed protein product [Peniophora sp. CBMAI 1063]|nr:unnamed protein product [Peniophora sp. CBMAI 1063]
MSLSTLQPLPPPLSQACLVRCDHPLPFWDCLARIIARCLHRRFPNAPEDVLLLTALLALSLGWDIPHTPSNIVLPGARLVRAFAPDLELQATVIRPLAHDGTTAIFACALTSVVCGPSTIHIPPRMLLLKTFHPAHAKFAGCDPECDCSVRCAGIDRQILAAARHQLTDCPAPLSLTTARLLPLIDAALNCGRAPSQFVCAFSQLPGTRFLGFPSITTRDPPPPLLATIIENPLCAFPPGHLECRCPPTAIGACEALDDDYFGIVDDAEGEVLEPDIEWTFV